MITEDFVSFETARLLKEKGFDEDAIIWNNDGTYKEIDKEKTSSFSYISYDIKFKAVNKETNLHDFMWGVIEKFAKQAQEGKF